MRFITGLIIPAVVITVLNLFRKYLPPSHTAVSERPFSPSELQQFGRTKWFVGVGIVLAMLVFAFGTYTILIIANREFADADGPANFRLLPSKAIWWFFPGFGAVSLSWQTVLLLWAAMGDKESTKRYVQWGNQRQGFDGTKVMNWLAATVALPIGLATVMAIPLHTSLRDHEIVIGQYAKLSVRHCLYSNARRLTIVDGFRDRGGKFTSRAELIVDFSDGYRWRSADNRDFTPAPDVGLASFLEQKTGLPVEHLETEKDMRSGSGVSL